MENLTPKAIIHQRYGDQVCYEIEEVPDDEFKLCPGLSISQKKPTLFRCILVLPSLSVTSGTFKRKKDAEQSAAEIALNKLGINLTPEKLTEPVTWSSLGNRILYLLSDEFLSSDHPLTRHIKSNLCESNPHPSISSSVLATFDHKLASLCKTVEPSSESNPILTANLVKKAALNQPTLTYDHDFMIRRTSPYPTKSLRETKPINETTLITAVLIPYSDEQVKTITLTVSDNDYYLDVIARSLGESDAKRIVLSRSVGSASSHIRLHFVGEGVNVRGSYLSAQRVCGDSIMASIGYRWKSDELFFEHLTSQSYYRMILKKTPTGIYKLSKNAILAPLLPRLFTSKANWRSSPPKELLFSFCRLHRLSEPIVTTTSLPQQSIIDSKNSISHFQCSIKLLSKLRNRSIQCSPNGSYSKQIDAINSTALKLLNWLNLFFDHPDPMEALKESAELLNVTFDSEFFSSFIPSPRIKTYPQPTASAPNGCVAYVSYTASLVSSDGNRKEIIEEIEEFGFEIGVGAVIPPMEDAVSRISSTESSSFVTDPPPPEYIFAALQNPERISYCLDSYSLHFNVTLLSMTEPPEERMETAFFHPPLSKQRVEYALKLIKTENVSSMIDYGCGSGDLLQSLLEHSTSIETIVGVDLSQRGLVKAAKTLNTKLKENPVVKSVILYELSILTRDRRMSGFDLATCIEVIEHLQEEEAWEFGRVALGYFRPKVLLVSTPNYEYNVVLRNGREDDGKFRNPDHKFEWTREEFQRWANALAGEFRYGVEYGGVGVSNGYELGYASQMAVFHRRFEVEKRPEIDNRENVLWGWEAHRGD